jgi:heme-degrading monooxygenase HmoA
MAITIIVPIPSREDYESVNEKMFGTKRPLADMDGLIVHTAGQGPKGFCVVDVWESKEAFDDFFNSRVMPAMQELGFSMEGADPPTIIELDNVVVSEAARV